MMNRISTFRQTDHRARGLRRAAVLGVAVLFVVAGCSSSDSDGDATGTTTGGATTVVDSSTSEAPMSGELEVSDARIPVPANPDVAAVYMEVVNNSDVSDTLESASSDVDGSTEIHQTTNENGVMSMSPAGPIEIAAGATLSLKPGSYHIMIMDPTKALALGDTVTVTLNFAHAGAVVVEATVVDPATVMSGSSGSDTDAGHDSGGDSGMSGMSGGH